MKKIISLLLTIILCVSCVTVVTADDFNALSSLGISTHSGRESEAITKQEFSAIIAKLFGSGTKEACDTRYADVDKSIENSGYIEFLAQNGIVDGMHGINYAPNGNVTVDMANKMFINILNYGKLALRMGGYPNGYSTVARMIGLTEDVFFKNNQAITIGEALTMAQRALTTEIAAASNEVNDDWNVNETSGETLLSQRFGISAYYGTIKSTDYSKKTVTFKVSGNRYDTNPVMLANGEEVRFSAGKGINVAKFEYAPVILWVNADEKVVHIEEQRDVEIFYATIDSVNGSRAKTTSKPIRNINKISFLDNEEIYDVSNSAKLYLNGSETSSSVKLIGKVSRIVVTEGEITSIQTWDFKEGGIITNIGRTDFTYKNQNHSTYKIKDLDKYTGVRVIIDGRDADISELKADSTFDWWAKGDELVIAVSEETIVDVMSGYTTGGVEIGNAVYSGDTIYYSEDGEKYVANDPYITLGALVKAYMSPAGYIKYVEKLSDGKEGSKEFYGIVHGVERGRFMSNESEILVQEVADGSVEEILKITKRTKFVNTSLTAIENEDKTNFGTRVYIMTKNEEGVLTKITPALRMKGLENESYSASFTNTSMYPAGITSAGDYFFFGDTPVTVAYELDGELKFKEASLSTLRNLEGISSCKVTVFAEEGELTAEKILLWGNTTPLYNYAQNFAIYHKQTKVINEDGEIMRKITVLGKNGNSTYTIPEEMASSLTDYSFILYYSGLPFSKNKMTQPQIIANLTGDPSEWILSGKMHKAVFKKTNDKMMVVEETVIENNMEKIVEKFIPIHPNQNFYVEYDSSNDTNPFKLIKFADLMPGDTIFYNRPGSDGVKGIIVVR